MTGYCSSSSLLASGAPLGGGVYAAVTHHNVTDFIPHSYVAIGLSVHAGIFGCSAGYRPTGARCPPVLRYSSTVRW